MMKFAMLNLKPLRVFWGHYLRSDWNTFIRDLAQYLDFYDHKFLTP